MFPPDQKWFGGFFLSVKELSAFKFSMTFSLYIERGKMSRKYYEKKRKKRRAILITSPLRDFKRLVVDAVIIGRMCMGESRGAYSEDEIRDAILAFAGNYGLLGLMTGLPTTPDFLDYGYVYFPKNRIIGRESMAREDYVRMFFPFGEPDLTLSEDGTLLSLGSDIPMQALGMTFAALLLSLFQYIGSKRRRWIYLVFIFLCWLASSYFWTAYLATIFKKEK